MSEYKCSNGNKCKKVINKLGTTKNFRCAGFIMPDGKMINFCKKENKIEHVEIGKILKKEDSWDEVICFMKQCKAVRFNKTGGGMIFAQAHAKPTPEQIKKVQQAVGKECYRFIGYSGEDFHPVHKSEEDKYATKIDVMRWVNKGW